MSGTTVRLRIVHETNPAKYFPALIALAARPEAAFSLVGLHRYSVFKEWLRAGLKDRTPLGPRSRNAWADLRFRLRLPWLRGETIVLGFAPWDPRLLLYRGLARRNRLVYHTSWHDWHLDKTPRQPRPAALKRRLRRVWLDLLQRPEVEIVAVTPVVAQAVEAVTGRRVHVIPHAVPACFFEAAAARAPRPEDGPLRLLFVGEVSEKKGIPLLRAMMGRMTEQPATLSPVTLSIVGDGALAEGLRRDPPPGTRFLGPIQDRARLAEIMAEHDLLLVPSQRENGWEELFGIVIVEALAAGCAVLASDHVGPRGVLVPAGGAGLVAEDDPEAWLRAVTDLGANPGRLAALRAKQAPVAGDYAIEDVMQAWQKVLER